MIFSNSWSKNFSKFSSNSWRKNFSKIFFKFVAQKFVAGQIWRALTKDFNFIQKYKHFYKNVIY